MTSGSLANESHSPTQGSIVKCDRVSVLFAGGVRAVVDVDLTASSGKILSLVGPSGCGKTTLLRLIAGLQTPTDGHVSIEPEVRGQRGEVGFVFQQPALLKWRTAIENVLLPLELSRCSAEKRERLDLARDMLEQVNLSDAANRFPHQLSGGMQMRVSIARALVTRPRLLLLDEPFAALDEMLRNQLGELLLSLWDTQRLTTILVTHNIAEAVMMSHAIAVMRDGRVEKKIDNDLDWPRSDMTRRSAHFGEMYGQVSDALRGVGA